MTIRMKHRLMRQLPLHIMLIPAVVAFFLFNYIPMFGIIMAFQEFNPVKGFLGSKLIGLENFSYIFAMPDSLQVIWNTFSITFNKLIFVVLVALIFSLMLNEVRRRIIKKYVQTIVFFPYFLSWVILGGIIIDILSPSTGVVNNILKSIGIEPIFFLADQKFFPSMLVISNTWKEFGYASILCLAALTSIDPVLYEAATADGAGRWRQILHITLPGIIPIIFVLLILEFVIISNGQINQILVLYNPVVYKTGDIIDSLVFRLGLYDAQYGVATAFGMMKSVVTTLFVVVLYKMAYKFANYKMF